MNTTQKNELSMITAVQAVLDSIMATGAPPLLGEKNAALKTARSRILLLNAAQEFPAQATMRMREQALHEASDLVARVSAMVVGHARTEGLLDLETIAKLTRSELHSMRRAERMTRARRVLEAVRAVAPAVAPYGVTSDLLDGLEVSIETASGAVESMAKTMLNKTTSTEMLAEAFQEVRELLRNQIDPIMGLMERTRPEAVLRYKRARRVFNFGGTRGGAEDEETPATTPTTPAREVVTTPVEKLPVEKQAA